MRVLAITTALLLLPTTGFAASIGRSDSDLRKALLGSWVWLDEPPVGPKAGFCATDAGTTFAKHGRYSELYRDGRWSVSHGAVKVVVTRSSAESGGERPATRLKPPETWGFIIDKLEDDLAEITLEQGPAWLLRCGAD